MADKRISQLIERVDIANNDVLPIVASGATTTNKVTISTIQEWMQDNLDVGVTSVGITIGSTGTDINVTGSPVTTSGNITINIPTASATNRGLLSSSDWTSFNSKLSSVGLTMPSAFTVSNSPLTANGTIAVTGAGTVAQYIRGDGSLADFPEAGGGGASVSYYLNGSVSQGTIGGIAYREMNKTPILGAGTDFTIAADGYIASFITDAGDPNLLLIPGGNWNLETYFAASSGGGSPSFYVELYKVDSGGTATLIASNSANPELIAFGTTTTAYFSSLAVPPTVLTLTDRLALRYYVTHAGRTITMHTEDANLCQVITTFTTGLTALNGLTAQVQNFATGTSGTDFNISSSSATHTFNIPDASASNRGAVTTGSQIFGGVKTFANGLSLSAVGGSNQVTRIVNIGTLHEGSATLNQIGFNSGNNIYFGKGLSNGGVISWNNAAVRYYTLPDADGTIALTSDLGNYIQGVGTADSIPKFTAARTLANSAIRDTTSTVVISKNVSVDNGASQAINLTPASGGTTNRIETTGTLPLSIITSGSSITLAAGGVTPQITLASTGAVTLTGALNGTSASFTGAVTSTGTGLNPSVRLTNTTASTGTDWHLYSLNNGNLGIYNNTAGAYSLQIASTGAATFSSSVTATSGVFTTGITLQGAADTSILNTYSVGGTIYGYNGVSGATNSIINGSVLGDLVIRSQNKSILFSTNGGSTSAVTITSSGNVGIGTASPASRLEVSSGNPASSEVQRWSYNTANPDFSLRLRQDVSSGLVKHVYDVVNNATTYSNNLVLTNGNVGIGTASPIDKLNVNAGGITFTGSLPNPTNTSVGSLQIGYDGTQGVIQTWQSSPLLISTYNYQAFSTFGTERMRITSAGNIGIGTSSPDSKLSVFGTFRNFLPSGGGGDTLISAISGVSNGYLINVDTSNNITHTWHTGANAASMRITSVGNVLIGTTTDAGFRLNVAGNTYSNTLTLGHVGLNISDYNFYSQTISGAMGILGHNVRASASVANQVNVVNSGWYTSMIKMYYSEGITFHTSPTVYSAGDVYPMAATERMRITFGGNVLIGTTTNLGSELNVNSTIRVGVAFGSAATIAFGDAGTPYWSVGRQASSGNFSISSYALTAMTIIPTSGNVLIGTTTDAGYTLNVAGNAQFIKSSTSTAMVVGLSGVTGSIIRFSYNGGFVGSISTDGSNTAYNTSSDYRLKEQVRPIDNPLEKVLKLNPVNFKYKNSKTIQDGFIAHEIQEILPYLVTGEKDGVEMQEVDYSKLTPILIAAIKEQQKQIEELKNKLS